jgi:hypothetical protein
MRRLRERLRDRTRPGIEKAQEKSARVLMLVENAARRMVMAISSVTLSNAFLITSKVTGSMLSPSCRFAGACGSVMLKHLQWR